MDGDALGGCVPVRSADACAERVLGAGRVQESSSLRHVSTHVF